MTDYIRDLRPAKWGSGVSLHGINLELVMSALCHSRPKCAAANNALFDHLVGAGEQRRRHSNAKCLSGFHIDG
jgi:hypothetical protein